MEVGQGVGRGSFIFFFGVLFSGKKAIGHRRLTKFSVGDTWGVIVTSNCGCGVLRGRSDACCITAPSASLLLFSLFYLSRSLSCADFSLMVGLRCPLIFFSVSILNCAAHTSITYHIYRRKFAGRLYVCMCTLSFRYQTEGFWRFRPQEAALGRRLVLIPKSYQQEWVRRHGEPHP